jgi:hypothetical protein
MTNTQQAKVLKAAHAATIATLIVASTHDPTDAMRLAADLFAMSAYRAELELPSWRGWRARARRSRCRSTCVRS